MIISGKSIQNVLKVYGEQNQGVKNTKSDKNQIAQGKDEFILSPSAQEFSQFLSAAKGLSDVRENKVKEFSDQIDAGTYQVDSQGIAEKMLGIYG
ncbi:flagellar biosynthesis anti-sigma factor FlgM [Pelosinus sp. sgz500959]|uniref:flagellar biosynthesis anti-sigma factor FlgM n=1 Tax=Pelosinus sp. sgz500959 TaxID=3242472 RepID=UPI00366AC413